ncbi:hypothetical protein [Solidesulfovibrio sp.]
MDAPYDPETGQWTVFGDPRPVPAAPGGPVPRQVMSMPATRPEAFTTQALLTGNLKEAERYVPVAHQKLQQMHRENVNGLEVYNKLTNLGDGKTINCERMFSADSVHINIPRKASDSLGPLHLNFNPSKMQEFDRTLFDMNHGLPLYMNEFNASLSKDGLIFDNLGDELPSDPSVHGGLHYGDMNGNVNGRTFFVPLGLHMPFRTVDAGPYGTILTAGNGYCAFFNYMLTPYNSSAFGLYAYTSGSTWEGGDLSSYVGISNMGGGSDYVLKHTLDDKFNHIFSFRVKGTDFSINDMGVVDSVQTVEVFVDGSKKTEFSSEKSTWGDYYDNNKSEYSFNANISGDALMAIKQKMLYAAHLSDSQIREVTDNLAKKWGF